MNKILDLVVDNITFILIAIGIIVAIYYALVSKSEHNITGKFIERYNQILEITLAGACIVEANIASRIAAEADMSDARFLLHIILVFLSMVTGFRISKEITEVVTATFALVQSFIVFKLGLVIRAITALILQLVGAILNVVATLAGPVANWILIAISQGDASVDLKWDKVNSLYDVIVFNYLSISFNNNVHDWTFSSFAVLFLHITVILILTVTSADKQVLDSLEKINLSFKKDKIEDKEKEYEDKMPKDFHNVAKYITANTSITSNDLSIAIEKGPKAERFPRKQELNDKVRRAILFRETKDLKQQVKAHNEIESRIIAWLREQDLKPEYIQKTEDKIRKANDKKSVKDDDG